MRGSTRWPDRQPSYSGPAIARLRRSLRFWSAAALLLTLGSLNGGCSYRLGNWGAKDDKPDPAEHTGSIKPPPKVPIHASAAALPPDGDLAFARAAAQDVLNHGAADASLPWENPHTGARGTVTPIASAYSSQGITCRDFLASYVREGAESWLQGEACRADEGKWEVRSIRPWKRT